MCDKAASGSAPFSGGQTATSCTGAAQKLVRKRCAGNRAAKEYKWDILHCVECRTEPGCTAESPNDNPLVNFMLKKFYSDPLNDHTAGWDSQPEAQPVNAEFVVRGDVYATQRLREHCRYMCAAWLHSGPVSAQDLSEMVRLRFLPACTGHGGCPRIPTPVR